MSSATDKSANPPRKIPDVAPPVFREVSLPKVPKPVSTQQFFLNTQKDVGLAKEADDFVCEPTTGGLDYGYIDPKLAKLLGIRALPIRLKLGRHRGESKGFGVQHIYAGHAPEFVPLGYFSVQDYVSHVAWDYDAVADGHGGKTIVLVKESSHERLDRLLVLRLSDCGRFYLVTTGHTMSGRRRKKLRAEKNQRGDWQAC